MLLSGSSSSPSAQSAGPVLRVNGVHKRFGRSEAVAGVDLQVARGEYVCILGPSGSGKSTLLRLVAGFETPDRGEVHLEGIRVDALPPERRSVHTVFQGYALFPHLSVHRNVAFGLEMRGVPADEIRTRVDGVLEMVGLGGFGRRSPAGLSGGEQQRVALARALVNRPPLLLLDEPLAALDRKLRLRMQEELRGIQQESGIAFLHVTHDQEEALRLADRVAVMDGGRILQAGPPDAVYRFPRSRFVADFLGSANLLRGRVEGTPPKLVLEGGGTFPLPPGSPPLPAAPPGGWAVRPEALQLVSPDAGDPSIPLPGRVLDRTSLGPILELRVELDGGVPVRAHVSTAGRGPLPAPGERLTLWLHPRHLVPLEG